MTGGRCSEVDLVLKLFGRNLEWSLLTGGRYLEVVVSTGLTVSVNVCHPRHCSTVFVKTRDAQLKSHRGPKKISESPRAQTDMFSPI